MPREALMGLTLTMTLAALGAGNAGPDADSQVEAVKTAPPVVNTAQPSAGEEENADLRRLSFETTTGKVHLIGSTGDNEVSVTVRFDASI